eukprot:8011879-Pyramimonas_sp.AAC.2
MILVIWVILRRRPAGRWSGRASGLGKKAASGLGHVSGQRAQGETAGLGQACGQRPGQASGQGKASGQLSGQGW